MYCTWLAIRETSSPRSWAYGYVMCRRQTVTFLLTRGVIAKNEMKWNESGFRPPLCTYRLNWARRISWGWWDDWDDTVLQTQDSKFEPWRSEAEHATSRSRRLPTILTFTRGWGRNNFVSFKPPRPGTEPRTLAWKAAVLTTTLGPPPRCDCSAPEKHVIRPALGEHPLCTRFWTNAVLLSRQHRRPWNNVKSTLIQCIVLSTWMDHSRFEKENKIPRAKSKN